MAHICITRPQWVNFLIPLDNIVVIFALSPFGAAIGIVVPCTVCPSVHPSVCPALITHNIQWILVIFGPAIDRLWGFCVYFLGSSGTLKFYEYTNWLASWTRPAEGSCPLDSILNMIFPCFSDWPVHLFSDDYNRTSFMLNQHCHLFDTSPLLDQMLIFDLYVHISVKFESKFYNSHSRNAFENVSHVIQASKC